MVLIFLQWEFLITQYLYIPSFAWPSVFNSILPAFTSLKSTNIKILKTRYEGNWKWMHFLVYIYKMIIFASTRGIFGIHVCFFYNVISQCHFIVSFTNKKGEEKTTRGNDSKNIFCLINRSKVAKCRAKQFRFYFF